MIPTDPIDRSEESCFLSRYSLEDFDRPSVTADIAVFSMRTQQGPLYRMNPEQKLCILLIRRGEHPFRGQWALPGGFLRKDETIEDCALRELREETNLTPVSMIRADVYSQPGRDPRGWILSHSFASIISQEDAKICGGSDAAEAQWFEVQFTSEPDGSRKLTLSHPQATLTARLEQTRTGIGSCRYRIVENQGLAFDHAAIIAGTLFALRTEAENLDLAFAFLPDKFTLSALQKVQETLMGISYLSANFRRKVADRVVETDEFTTGAGHRPARLFRRNED